MPSETAYLIGGFIASEATGITNFTPIGRAAGDGDNSSGRGPPNLGGLMPNIDLPAFDAPAFQAPNFQAPAFDFPTFEAPAFDFPAFEAPNYDFTIPQLPKQFEIPERPSGPLFPNKPGGSGASGLDPESAGGFLINAARGTGEAGGDFWNWWKQLGPGTEGTLRRAGRGTGDIFGIGEGFVKENPYFTTGAAAGAAPLGPVGLIGGAAVGGLAEISSDTLTGGTPLGVNSPLNITAKKWWKGPDPLNLGGKSPGQKKKVEDPLGSRLFGGKKSGAAAPSRSLRRSEMSRFERAAKKASNGGTRGGSSSGRSKNRNMTELSDISETARTKETATQSAGQKALDNWF